MPRIKHIYHANNEEYEILLGHEFISICCDCALVHKEVYTIRDGKLFCTAKRDNRATGQYRRYQNIKYDIEEQDEPLEP